VILATLTGLAALAGTGSGPQGPPAGEDGGRLSVYLVTFGPGPRVWERFGHNAIWIRDTVSGDGPAYDFGRFDFQDEHFFRNFADGRMMYWMGRDDGVALVNYYVGMKRSVWLQHLALPPAARLRLRRALDSAYAADRGRYRYHYYLDNCSTRVRDAIDAVVGGAARAALTARPSGTTWRFHTRRSLQHSVPQYFGVTASLGPAGDEPITRWDETFLPGKLFEYLRDVVVTGEAGRLVPLVKGELAVADSPLFGVPAEPADWTPRFLLGGMGLGLGLAGLGWLSRSAGWGRRGFLLVGGTWTLLAGAFGAVFLFFWAFSEHRYAFRNQNLWQLNLLSLALLPLLPAATRRDGPGAQVALVLGGLIGGLAVAGAILQQGLPTMGQANGDILAFTVPAQAGLAVGVWLAVRNRESSSTPPSPR
jgi:hypothetical protein